MKKYVFEADKTQWEKPTEPKYVFCPAARVTVYADTPAKAKKLAEAGLREKYHGTGVILGEARQVSCSELPVDWSYGYGGERGKGGAKDRKALVRTNVIR